MLIRIILLFRSPRLLGRIQNLIPAPHALVAGMPAVDSSLSDLARQPCDIVIAEKGALPEPHADAIAAIRRLPDRPEVIVVADMENPEQRAALLAAGCFAVVYAGLSDSIMAEVLETLIGRRREERMHRMQPEKFESPSLKDFATFSPAMQRFMTMIYKVVDTDSSLLILGETGAGKERLGRAIHNDGPRAGGPFVSVNCAALPEMLLESELFGYEKGAFTGAFRPRRGYFELAHRGTLFLDEIGEMPLHLQAKLLQVLQDRVIHPLGSEKSVGVDVRIIAATNKDLEAEKDARRFREDLYYRLSVVSLTIPPIRQRREDIPELLAGYLAHFCRRFGRRALQIEPDALTALVAYEWPGNIRELINVVERAVLLCSGTRITLADLPESIRQAPRGQALRLPGRDPAGVPSQNPGRPAVKPWRLAREEALEQFEREYLVNLLRLTRGRINDSAKRAGIAPRSLYEKMKYHGLRKEDFRSLDIE